MTLNSFIDWPPAPGGIFLALIPDRPALILADWLDFFSVRELAEGRSKASPTAGRNWFLGRLAAKAAAGRLWGLDPARVEVLHGQDGRPVLFSPDGPLEAGLVSISHTAGAAVGAAGPAPVGVDLERRDRRLTDRLARWAFTGLERELAASAPSRSFPGLLALWCAREAAAKSWGRALLNHLDRVRVVAADWPAGRLTVAWLERVPREPETSLQPDRPREHDPGGARAEVHLLVFDEYVLALAGADRVPAVKPSSDFKVLI